MTQELINPITIKIEDWYNIIDPFDIVLAQGPNYIIGPNGAGNIIMAEE